MQKLSAPLKNSSHHSISHAADCLTLGAMAELCLTPKPGLVDRLDNGSHPDLSYEKMLASINLLPVYYRELGGAYLNGAGAADLRKAGIEAEKRMLEACGSNTHKGYIFLSGLILLADIGYDDVQKGIIHLSESFFKSPLPESNGETARKKYAVGGIAGECLNGLPSLFDHALPAMRAEYEAGKCAERAKFAGLAKLMQTAEDTTALHRCGAQGLDIIRADGARLEELLKNGTHKEWLERRNEYYKSIRLTMGGVADLLAASTALSALGKNPFNLIA